MLISSLFVGFRLQQKHMTYSKNVWLASALALGLGLSLFTFISTASASHQINLSWQNVAHADDFHISRSTDGVLYGAIATSTGSPFSYSDTGLTCGTLYYYKITAHHHGGDTHTNASEASATTQACPPTTGTLTVVKTLVGGEDATFEFTVGDEEFDIETLGGTGEHEVELAPGTYTVTETAADGWATTYSGDCQSFSVIAGGDYECEVTNTKLSSISGVKFHDHNGNGDRDIGDEGLEDWTIELNDGVSTTTITTNEDGEYSFLNLGAGTYLVCEVQQIGWMQTSNAGNCHTVTVGDGVSATDETVNFGNFQLGVISGYKFHDSNVNGVWDGGELALDGWVICLNGSDCVTTGAGDWPLGYYEFVDLAPDTYTVCETLQPGWVPTMPSAGGYDCGGGTYGYELTIDTSAQVLTDNNFGNFCLEATGGKGIGFWSNKNGQALLDSDDFSALNALKIVNEAGSDVVFLSATQVKNYLTGSEGTRAKNMAHKLSGQLAAVQLSVLNAGVSADTLIYVAAVLPDPGAFGLSDVMSIGDIIAAANSALEADQITLGGDPNRPTQEALKNLLEAIASNQAIAVCD
jgi:hypothetical protein